MAVLEVLLEPARQFFLRRNPILWLAWFALLLLTVGFSFYTAVLCLVLLLLVFIVYTAL